MGYFFEFDALNNVVRSTCEGRVTDEMVWEVYNAMVRFRASRPPCRGIIDLSYVTAFLASSETIKNLASRSPTLAPTSLGIIVAPADSSYGMSRMFTMFNEEQRPNLHVVRTIKEAYRLLDITSPRFTRVEID